ncbi:hypothetical protein DN820_01880 [Stutzerimonas nosocomialis]|uniref:Uncharacterized protein n=2 Tax=Stutzerimonas nosocomialis TaxID=1056496 RepID=A0A5R9QIK7_9GAMM|nr:hypothetical protein DN820_01880 [Stutzerimonas nosocomialis]
MAIYTVKQGQLVKAADTLEQFTGRDLIDDYDQLLRSNGFVVAEEQAHAYMRYVRLTGARPSPVLHGIKYVFDVAIDNDSVEYILVTDDLGAYLDVVRMLEPLVNRGIRLEQELERETLFSQ